MEFDLILSESDKFYKDHSVLENFITKLDILINEYKIGLETVSILCKIDLDKINLFYSGKGYLTYNEMEIIQTVFLYPFEKAIKISKENYDKINKI